MAGEQAISAFHEILNFSASFNPAAPLHRQEWIRTLRSLCNHTFYERAKTGWKHIHTKHSTYL